MDKLFILIGAGVSLALIVLVAVIAGTLLGALGGWIVGWFFSDTILGILAQLGIKGIAMWQLGAFLGFVGGFFRTSVSK